MRLGCEAILDRVSHVKALMRVDYDYDYDTRRSMHDVRGGESWGRRRSCAEPAAVVAAAAGDVGVDALAEAGEKLAAPIKPEREA